MIHVRTYLTLTALTTLGLVLTPAAANADRGPDAIVERTVPATFEFREFVQPGMEPYCGEAGFVQWDHVDKVTTATAKYRGRSAYAADTGGPFSDYETSASNTVTAAFNNVFNFGATYTVDPGHDWIAVTWVAGGSATCTDGASRIQRMVDQGVPPVVTLSVQVAAPAVTSTRKTQRLASNRFASIGTVTCPTDGSCTIKAPKSVKVRLDGSSYSLPVRVPKQISAGKSVAVRVKISRAAASALSGDRVTPKVKVVATTAGVATTRTTVKRTIRR